MGAIPDAGPKPLRATVRPHDLSETLSFASRAARLFHDDVRIDAEPQRDGLLISCVWYAQLEMAHDRISTALPGDYVWSEPRIEYRYESVNCNGSRRVLVLEPILEIEVHTPPDFVGHVIGDLSSRRGMILRADEREGVITIASEVPLAELKDYVSKLAQVTSGAASATARFLKYSERPSGPPPGTPVAMALRA